MKKFLLLAGFLSFCLATAHAQDLQPGQSLLANGDFSDGTNHWRGDVKTAASESSMNLAAGASTATGAAIELRSKGTIMWQEIKDLKVPPNAKVDLSIDYSTTSDFTLKERHVKAIQGDPLTAHDFREPILVTLSPTTGVSLTEKGGIAAPASGFIWSPKAEDASHTLQKTITLPVPINSGSIWFKLWLPPGTGILFLSKISLTVHSDADQPAASNASPDAASTTNSTNAPTNSTSP